MPSDYSSQGKYWILKFVLNSLITLICLELSVKLSIQLHKVYLIERADEGLTWFRSGVCGPKSRERHTWVAMEADKEGGASGGDGGGDGGATVGAHQGARLGVAQPNHHVVMAIRRAVRLQLHVGKDEGDSVH